MKLIEITCTDARGKNWTEEYKVEDHEDVQKWGEYIIKRFNDTLRPHELPRELVSAKVLMTINDDEDDEDDEDKENQYDGW